MPFFIAVPLRSAVRRGTTNIWNVQGVLFFILNKFTDWWSTK